MIVILNIQIGQFSKFICTKVYFSKHLNNGVVFKLKSQVSVFFQIFPKSKVKIYYDKKIIELYT